MGTAVLHPQDYLAVPQNDRTCQFLCAPERPACVGRPDGRAISANHKASIPATKCGRDVVVGTPIVNRGCNLLSRRNSSAGLLPPPNQASQSSHNNCRRLAPDVGSYGSKHFTSSHHTEFRSYASKVSISRCPSVPILDYATRAQRSFSARFPSHGVQLHERKPLWYDGRFVLNSSQGNGMVGSFSFADRTANSCQKLKFLANSHFSDVFKPVRLNRADSLEQGMHYKKRMHPDLSHVEVYLGRQSGKPAFDALPEGQRKFFCTSSSVIGRKAGVNKQLKRAASEKLQEKLGTPILRKLCVREAARKVVSNSSEGLVGPLWEKCGRSKFEATLTSSAPRTPSLEGKIAKGPQMQVPPDAAQPAVGTVLQQMGDVIKITGASLDGRGCAKVNAATEHMVNAVQNKDPREGHKRTERHFSEDPYALCKGEVISAFNNQSAVRNNIRKPSRVVGSEAISTSHSSDLRSHNCSVLDNDEVWLSTMNDEKWAGPSFFNSPSPSSLPVPSFMLLFSRTLSTSSKQAKESANYDANIDKLLLEEKHTWDAAFATKDLRRMLHLDHASCDS